MSVEKVLASFKRALDTAGVPYMVTGSLASSTFGEPRASEDVDIVIAPTREQLVALIRQFPSDQYYALQAREDTCFVPSEHGFDAERAG